MASAFLFRGLALSSAALLFACSGTQAGPDDGKTDSAGGGDTRMSEPGDDSQATQDPARRAPGTGEVQESSVAVRLDERLTAARRALTLGDAKTAYEQAGLALMLDTDSDEARALLLAAQRELGDEAARVAASFDDKVLETVIAQERDRYRAQELAQRGDAQVELGRFGDAIESYQGALLILELNPLIEPGTQLEADVRGRLDRAIQRQKEAMEDAEAAEVARSREQLEEAERRRRLERDQRVARLLIQANRDFQLGDFRSAVSLLEKATLLDPNNDRAQALYDLASRADHETRMEMARAEWNQEWSETFQDLEHGLLPQTETMLFDLARWAEVSATRQPLAFSPPEDLEDPAERAIQQRLEELTIEHNISSATLEDWAKYYQEVSGVNFVITPSARELDEGDTTLEDFRLGAMPVASALNVISSKTGVQWTVRNGAVLLVSDEVPIGRAYLRSYEVRDIVQGVKNRPGPKLKLSVPEDSFGAGFGFDDDEPLPTVIEAGLLEDLIRDNIEPEAWSEGVATLNYQSGVLMVRAPKNIHERIDTLLSDLRAAVGIQVDVEARFLRVADSFLEDIGVDFRGLGDQSSEGLPGRGLEQNNRSNLRLDDFGRPEQINPASPGEIGTGTEPGIFFDDGGDGDLLARTENLYDRSLGGGPGELENSGGMSLQYAFLDDTELSVILRAVQKSERSEEIVAPRLLVYNNTRAHMQALRHTSYIRDFDVEIAQAAAVANPTVDVVRDGVVLDVRPVVSADRRFITMELRPTVLTLQLPIATFTTTLGAGQPVQIQLPEVTLQSVRTTVTMPDGGSVLLGGMKMAERQNQVSGVPFLKDLPLLSFFFSRKGTYVNNRKVIILIRASIILNEEWEPELIPDDMEMVLLSGR